MGLSKSSHLEVCFTFLKDNEATALDAFTEDWNRFKLAYIFPPPVMMELILNTYFVIFLNNHFLAALLLGS